MARARSASTVAEDRDTSKVEVKTLSNKTISKEKEQALSNALAQIDKAFGKGAIMRMDEHAYLNVPGISTGACRSTLRWAGGHPPRAHRRDLRAGILR